MVVRTGSKSSIVGIKKGIFSNSLIIHQVKTKKIAIVKEVWILGLNWHRF